MFEFIEKLRQKPETVKKRIAFFTALSVSLVIFVVWLSVLNLGEPRKVEEVNQNVAVEEKSGNKFTELFSSGWIKTQEQYANIKDAFSNFSTGVEYYSATSTEER